jgi:hypothetical protein
MGVELLYWLNTALLGLLGVAAIVSRRWRYLKWFPFYALIVFSLSVIYLGWSYTPEFSLMKRLVGELLALGVVVEVLRKDANRRPFWPWPALLCLAFVPFLPLDPYTRYYLPQEVFAIGLSLELATALRSRSAPLLAWSVIGIATVTGDAIKFLSPPREVLQILRVLDPIFFSAFVAILLAGFFRPELSRFARSLWKLKAGQAASVRRLRVAAGHADRLDAVSAPAPVIAFPEQRYSSAPEYELVSDLATGGKALAEALTDKLDALAKAIELSSRVSMSVRKPFLSPMELALYLGTCEETARRFVEHHGLNRVQLTDDFDEWVVFRAEVDEHIEE